VSRAADVSTLHRLARRPLLLTLIVLATAACTWTQHTGRLEPAVVAPVVAEAPPAAGSEAEAPGALAVGSSGAQPSSEQVPIDPTDAVRGSSTAPVTIVAFLDLQCPFCARVQPTLARLEAEYGPERLRLVFKHLPLAFHDQARPAADVAQAVLSIGGPDAFFRYVATLYDRQSDLGTRLYSAAASELGIREATVRQRSEAPEIRAQVDAQIELATRIGVRGTPGFRINGATLSGAQPYETFKKLIESELAAARSAELAGVPKTQIYRTRVAKNFVLWPEPAADAIKPDPPDEKVYRVLIGRSPVLGPKDALVTVIEFQDLQCPFCKRVQPTLQQIRGRYPDDVRIVFKHNPLPFHPRAVPASQLAIEARAQKGEAGFWKAIDALFTSSPGLEDQQLLEIARQLGLNDARARRAIAKPTHPEIEADQNLAVDQMAHGTPHFFINGRRLVGSQPLEVFTSLIDSELEKAQKLVLDRKLPRSRVYDEIMKTAEPPPPPEQKTVAVPGPQQPSHGIAGAPVVIQMFSDFQCPFCKRAQPTLDALEKKFPGKLRFVWRDLPLPFHPQARPAARAAREAFAQRGAKGFWAMHDLLFENQGKTNGLDTAALEGYAQSVGLDMARFRAALVDGRHDAAIDADLATAQAADIHGTPSFVINGYYLSGAQPLGTFSRLVGRALAERRPARAAKK
jgi:protein-disulfide isomerase